MLPVLQPASDYKRYVSFSLKGSTVSTFSFLLGKHWREAGVKELGVPAVLYGSP